MGLGLSFGGVFFLQATAHDIGARTMRDQPPRLTDVLAEQQQTYEQKVQAIRQRVTAEFMAGKIADEERKISRQREEQAHANPDPLADTAAPIMNGHVVSDEA